MFDLSAQDRLTEWRRFRDNLENSDTPLEDVAELWSRAPFVSSYLNPSQPDRWPDPWHLILDNKLDDLAIVLGMLYTLKLTQRFMESDCEIHMSMLPDKTHCHFLLVDNKYVLNYRYKEVVEVSELKGLQTNKLYSTNSNK